MKLLLITGSHRRNGNTARVLRILADALRADANDRDPSSDLEIEELSPTDLHIEPCRGCRVCFDRGEDKCPLDDDVLSVRDKIVAADGLVLASPVYVNDVSGTMKTLVDRLAFVCHRPAFMGTPALILATTAGSPTKHTLRTMQSAHISWGGAIIASAGFVTGALSSTEEIRRKYGKRLESLARTVVETITEKHWKSPSFISLVVFTIQQKSWKRYAAEETKESTDAKYWRERGWFDSSSTYYFDHHAPWPRVAFARLVGSALARIFG